MSSSSTSPPDRPGLGKKFETATRLESAAKEQALRATKERDISRELHVIKNGVGQRFPEGQELPAAGTERARYAMPDHHCQGCPSCRTYVELPGRVTAPKPVTSPTTCSSYSAPPPSSHMNGTSSVDPQDATASETDGDSAKVVVGTTPHPPGRDGSSIEDQGRDPDRQPDKDPAIAEFRSQLADQKVFCEELQRDVHQKDGEIEALKAEVRSMRRAQAAADAGPSAEWTAKYENVKRLLQDTEEEVEKLEAQLKEVKNREKALQRQLDEAKDEADRRERYLRNRTEEAEDETRRLRGERDGLRGAAEVNNVATPQTSIMNYYISNQQLPQQPQQMSERCDSGVSTKPLLSSPLSSRSTGVERTSSQHSITSRLDSNGNKRLQAERRKTVNPRALGKVMCW